MVSVRAGRVLVADAGHECIFVLGLLDWLSRWRAIALAWQPLCAWRQRAAERAFAPGGTGYASVAATTMVGVERGER